MYKIGDKFIIEIDSIIEGKGLPLYGIRGFKALVFDEAGLMKLDRPSRIEAEQTDGGILIKGVEIVGTQHICGTCGRPLGATVCSACINNNGTVDYWEAKA